MTRDRSEPRVLHVAWSDRSQGRLPWRPRHPPWTPLTACWPCAARRPGTGTASIWATPTCSQAWARAPPPACPRPPPPPQPRPWTEPAQAQPAQHQVSQGEQSPVNKQCGSPYSWKVSIILATKTIQCLINDMSYQLHEPF